ncbi:MAG: two-component histidine kinase MprB [Actinomycetota bacterium]|jgi:two-component system sensor histidine kinase MprB
MNLRTRFVAITAGLVFVLATAMSIGAYRIATTQLSSRVNESLNNRIETILDIVADPFFSWQDAFGRGPANRAILQTETDSITQVVLPDGRILGRQENPVLPIPDDAKSLTPGSSNVKKSTITINSHQFKVFTVAASDGTLIQVAKDNQIVIDAQRGMRVLLPLFAFMAVVISGGAGWLFARRISQPLENLAETAESIAATQDLDRNIDIPGNDEVSQLARSFNTMLAALRDSSERQRRLIQDASHELRTPLTSLRANAELLERSTLPDADRAAILADIKAEVDELTDLSSELNALATDQRAAEVVSPVDLAELAHEIASRASRRTTSPVTVHVTDEHIVSARPHQLERALSNLVDNAIKFSNGESDVEIHVGAHRVEVRDHGPGISNEDKPKVFDRFYRATATRSMPGSGLGLAIVAQFADDNNAHTYVLDNAGGGTIVGLQFAN